MIDFGGRVPQEFSLFRYGLSNEGSERIHVLLVGEVDI
jgi:hypothetical protein